MRIVAAVTDPASVKTYLDGVGLKSEIPKLKPARAPQAGISGTHP